MQSDSRADTILGEIRRAVEYFSQDDLSAGELINTVFLRLGEEERFDLVDEVARLIPDSACSELRRVVEATLQPGSDYVPSVFGLPSAEEREARRRRMQPACRQLATLFCQHLDQDQADMR